MATMKLEIVTAEGTVYSGEVDSIVAPGDSGELVYYQTMHHY